MDDFDKLQNLADLLRNVSNLSLVDEEAKDVCCDALSLVSKAAGEIEDYLFVVRVRKNVAERQA